jgi:alkaline phosphatase
LIVAGVASAPALARSVPDVTFDPGDRPRHIIHMVADGMSQGTLTCAAHLSQILRQRGLHWTDLFSDPQSVTGMMDVQSLNSLVTDSAASSSAWGSGSRVVNGALNVLPDGRELRPIYDLLREAGWTRGLVTTTEITHATPAGFAVAVPKRSMGEAIADRLFQNRPEVLLGGGARFFEEETRSDRRNLIGEFRNAGYAVLRTREQLQQSNSTDKWVGLFAPSHLPFTIDHITEPDRYKEIPKLAEMTQAALGKLERETHFMLQVEGGRVDHGGHLNDAAGAFHDMIAFDDALQVCWKFQQRHPDTLLIVTTDHGTGNPGLNGTGTRYGKTTSQFKQLTDIKHSHEWMLRRIYQVPEKSTEDMLEVDPSKDHLAEPVQIAGIIEEAAGFRPSAHQAQQLHQFFSGQGGALYELANNGEFQLAQLLANHTGIGWTSLAHTADFVPIIARGPGAERFRGFIRNVEVFHHYTHLAGIDYKNPEARPV